MFSFIKRIFRSKNDEIIIVSGLPRSGTSMMMQILEKGGLEIITDNVRRADKDNPKGYYEFEKVKEIEKDTSWLSACRGKVVKMVSMLLFELPDNRRYKIVFMQRNMGEILASQKKMLQRLNKEDGQEDEKIKKGYEKHLRKITNWLQKRKNCHVFYVSYNNILKEPDVHIKKLNKFFNNRLDEQQMLKVVDYSLYRQRKQ
ncbi:MAG: sulfotransferase domain-containing protein [bacterium]